jgi:hypothetical protein
MTIFVPSFRALVTVSVLRGGKNVLQEVELFVARARPKIVAMNNDRLFFFVASFVDDREATFLSERRIGQHHLVFAMLSGERVLDYHWHVGRVGPDAV